MSAEPLSRICSPTIRKRKFAGRLAQIAREVFKAETFQSVTAWAEANRYLSETGTEFGRYRASRCPYQAAIQDSFADPEVREITWMAAERLGKSTVASNVLGYIIDTAPCSVLWVLPSREAMADFLKDELEPMFAASPVLKAKIAAGKVSKGKTNSVRRKTFQGGVATFVGGGSASPLAFRTVKTVVLDELHKLKPLPEGDADALASKRVSTFTHDFKILRLSKPTDEGSSRIHRHFLLGTQSRYVISCPGCQEYQEPGWALLRFDDVKMRCASCNGFFDQDTWLEQPGEWRETVPNPTDRLRKERVFLPAIKRANGLRFIDELDQYRGWWFRICYDRWQVRNHISNAATAVLVTFAIHAKKFVVC